MAVGIGILLGCLRVFLYPDGLFRSFCTSPSDDQDSAAPWSQARRFYPLLVYLWI
ncbi:hypothetical protein MUK42_33715 [Musa troglodytarum]|uniref:Uncharacterized protein n=1 Tax=Musa troglodytarum TaxID=320322 RepID=A0A9E7EG51_9LILI|nr:hypothetical protein MUK42_33715 [Musa troglodytarum]